MKDVFVFRIGHLGDTLVALPAISKIKEIHREEDLFLITNKPSKDFKVSPWDILRYTNYFKDVIFYEPGNVKSLMKLFYRIKSYGRNEVLYYLTPERSLIQVARDYIFFKILCGFKKAYGIKESLNEYILRDNYGKLITVEKEFERLLKIIHKVHGLDYRKENSPQTCLLNPPTEAYGYVNDIFKKIPKDSMLIAIGHGSKISTTKWNLSKFIKLSNHLLNYNKRIFLVIVGGKDDFKCGEYLRSRFENRTINLCGKTNIIESAVAISKCILFIGNDSGPLHLAGSMGVPCIGIYSARNNPGRWEPYGNNHVILRKDIECAGCFLEECVEKKQQCIDMISVDEVLEAAIGQIKWCL
ncbi:MAG: glycosyltransferase family 9 protein [Candidatus Brocadia sp.]|nr:glycosyltransferase family 9 protein [Candidatus Brocadia sp.]